MAGVLRSSNHSAGSAFRGAGLGGETRVHYFDRCFVISSFLPLGIAAIGHAQRALASSRSRSEIVVTEMIVLHPGGGFVVPSGEHFCSSPFCQKAIARWYQPVTFSSSLSSPAFVRALMASSQWRARK